MFCKRWRREWLLSSQEVPQSIIFFLLVLPFPLVLPRNNLVVLQVRSWSLKASSSPLQNKKETEITSQAKAWSLPLLPPPYLSNLLLSMAGIEDGEVVLEEAISWLPSHIVLDHEALWDSKVYQYYIYRYCFIDKPSNRKTPQWIASSSASGFISLSVFLVPFGSSFENLRAMFCFRIMWGTNRITTINIAVFLDCL